MAQAPKGEATGLNALGRHLLLELFDCAPDAIDSLEAVKGALVEAARRAQATIVDVVFHEFNPFGISGVVVIAESHLSINPQSYKWFFETTTPVEGHMHAIVRTIVSARTKFQQVEIMETASYGKCLVLDGRIQSSAADEFVYHEALVHPGLLAVDAPPT